MSIQSLLKQKFPRLVGELKIKNINNTVLISGNVFVDDEKEFSEAMTQAVYEKYPNALTSNNVKVNEFFVIEDSVDTNVENEVDLDEVDVLYYGKMNVNHIVPNDEFKIIHENNRPKLDNCVKVLGFISPIILDSDLKVIDGNFRLQLAKSNGIEQVMVVVIDDNEKRANFLRLALNRTAEFQRWNYREVDDYVDGVPQAQPILEPIGFFGRYVLPESYFSNTVVKYEIDPFNEKQRQYLQEEGLEEWAKYRREQMAKLSAEKRANEPKKVEAVSLFDLAPKEEDFLETYDIDEEMDDFVEKYKKIAGEITDHLDDIKRKEIEEKGGVWQFKHRTSLEVAEENRMKAIESIQESDLLSEEEKVQVVENIDEYADYIEDVEQLVQILRGDD